MFLSSVFVKSLNQLLPTAFLNVKKSQHTLFFVKRCIVIDNEVPNPYMISNQGLLILLLSNLPLKLILISIKPYFKRR